MTGNQTLAQWLVRHHRWLAALSLLLTVVAVVGITRMAFIADFSTLHGKDSSEQADIEALAARYTTADSVFLILHPAAGSVFSPQGLQQLEAVTAQAWTLPYVSRVESLTNHQRIRVEGDAFVVSDLVPDAGALTQKHRCLREIRYPYSDRLSENLNIYLAVHRSRQNLCGRHHPHQH